MLQIEKQQGTELKMGGIRENDGLEGGGRKPEPEGETIHLGQGDGIKKEKKPKRPVTMTDNPAPQKVLAPGVDTD